MKGLSRRAIGRIAGTYLTDAVKVEIYAGRSAAAPGVPAWAEVGTYNGRLLDRSGGTYTEKDITQAYDCQVIIQAGDVFADKAARYRVTVTEFKSPIEADDPEGEPEVKRTRILETVACDPYKDSAGTDFLQVLRCKNGVE